MQWWLLKSQLIWQSWVTFYFHIAKPFLFIFLLILRRCCCCFRFTHWLQCCFVDWPQWPGHQWRLAVGRLLTTQVSQLGARLACKNSSSFSVFLKLEVSVIFLFLNVYFLQMAEKKCMLVFSSVLSSNTCLAALWCNHSIWAWEYFGIDTLEISDFLKSLSLLLIFRTAKSRWREELCCNKNWVIRSLAKPRLFSCSSVCLQEKTQRHPWPLHHWLVFFMFLNANSNTTLKKSNFDGFYLSGYTDSWADDEKYECDVGWQAFQAGCYKLTSEKTDWNTAQKTCQKMEANLVSIHTLPELEFIIRDLKKGVFVSGVFCCCCYFL